MHVFYVFRVVVLQSSSPTGNHTFLVKATMKSLRNRLNWWNIHDMKKRRPEDRRPLFFDSLKVGKFSKKWISSEENCIKQYLLPMATFLLRASIWCIFWLVFFEKFKTRKQKEKLNEQKQCFPPWNFLFGCAIDQISKAWTHSAGLSSQYLWVVRWVNAS